MSSGLELNAPSTPPSLDGRNSEERVQAMVTWFFENFDDPAQETPYDGREGGYQYIWGGPYEALDQLQDHFPDAPAEDVEAAVAEIESDGLYDWAPAGSRIQPDDLDDFEDDEPTIQERLASLQGQLNSIEQHIAFWRNRPPAMGHNNPPDAFRLSPDDEVLFEAEASINELRVELAKPDAANTADVATLERAEGRFRKLVAKIASGLKAVGIAIALGGAAQVGANIVNDPSVFVELLGAAADNVNAWVSYIQLSL